MSAMEPLTMPPIAIPFFGAGAFTNWIPRLPRPERMTERPWLLDSDASDALALSRRVLSSRVRLASAPAKRGITRDYTPFLLILQGMTLQLQGITLPPF